MMQRFDSHLDHRLEFAALTKSLIESRTLFSLEKMRTKQTKIGHETIQKTKRGQHGGEFGARGVRLLGVGAEGGQMLLQIIILDCVRASQQCFGPARFS